MKRNKWRNNDKNNIKGKYKESNYNDLKFLKIPKLTIRVHNDQPRGQIYPKNLTRRGEIEL